MIDSDLMAARGQEVDTKESVLAGLPLHNAIEAWQYSDDGPPEGEGDKPGDGQLPWVVTTELDDQSSASHSVERTTESSRKLSAIRGNLVRIARADTGSSSYPDLTSEDAADRRAADATAVGTADAIHADLMITKRPYALAGRWRADGVTVCTPAEALAIVGLYLRSQGEFAVYGSAPDRVALSLNRGLYYGSGSRDLLSSGWRWGHCLQPARRGRSRCGGDGGI